MESKNGAWATQDFISVWADNVTIDNVDILSKEEQNKAIEVMAKNFTLKNSEIKRVNEWGSGSIIFNAQNDEKDIGNATIENVKLYSWISCSNSEKGTLNTSNVTIDFTDNGYAGYYSETYGYGWSPVVKGPKNGTVQNNSVMIYVDSEIDLNGQIFTSNLQPYTTVVLTEDMAVDEMVNVTDENVLFDLGGHTITATCGDVSAVCEITVTAPTEMPDTNDSNMAVAGVCAALVLAVACAFAYRKRA